MVPIEGSRLSFVNEPGVKGVCERASMVMSLCASGPLEVHRHPPFFGYRAM